MEIIKASCAGACYGVQRALKLALDSTQDDGRAKTFGPLIHNPQVVQNLTDHGIDVAHTPKEAKDERVIIRSHGVTPQVLDELTQEAREVIDATCPHVQRAHKAAQRLAREGKTVLVVGEKSHPEVEGIKAWAKLESDDVYVVGSPEEIPEDLSDPVGIVVQTTQSRERLNSILDALHERGLNPELKDTICQATNNRQQAALKLAQTVDVMVVIGGHNSSNTTRLFEICSEYAPRAYHIETTDELNPDDFIGVARVGITAGASTPDDQIEQVIATLESWNTHNYSHN